METHDTGLYHFLHHGDDVKEKLNRLFETMTCHTVFLLDMLSNRFDFISKKLSDLLGYSSEIIENEGLFFISDLISTDDYRRLVSHYLNLLKQVKDLTFKPGQRYKDQFSIRKADGGYLPVKVFMTLYQEKLPCEESYFIGIIKEETEREGDAPWRTGIDNEKTFSTLQMMIEQLNGLMREPHSRLKIITHREIEILNLLSKGFSTKILASHLHISNHTVESHRKNLLTKFQVKNTPELIKAAHEYID